MYGQGSKALQGHNAALGGPCMRWPRVEVSRAVQGAVELNDVGAGLVAAACKLLQGPNGAAMTPEQCRFVNVDFLTSFWLVRS